MFAEEHVRSWQAKQLHFTHLMGKGRLFRRRELLEGFSTRFVCRASASLAQLHLFAWHSEQGKPSTTRCHADPQKTGAQVLGKLLL